MAKARHNSTISDADICKAQADIRSLRVKVSRSTSALMDLTEFARNEQPCETKGCLMLYGDTGTGKTTVLGEFMETQADKGWPHGRVLKVEVPGSCSVKGLAMNMLEALGDPAYHKGTALEMKKRINDFLPEKGCKLLLLDEAQQLVENKEAKAVREVADFIKEGLNNWGISIVLAGLPVLKKIEHENEQIQNRKADTVILTRYNWDNKTDRNDFRLIMRTIDGLLPFGQSSHLHGPINAWCLMTASDGNLRRCTKIISKSLNIANRRGLKHLDSECLTDAFNKLRDDNDGINDNPFERFCHDPLKEGRE